MALSEIRVNTTKTRTGVGTITYTETGPVITGIATASNFKTGSTNVHSTGVELANINTGGSTATFGGAISGTSATLSGALSGTTASFSGNVSVGGTFTYEDVTNIDAVGLVTARNGIKVLAGGANVVGVVTATSFVGALPISNDTNNRVLTGTGSGGINGETNLTFDHNQLFINCGNYSYPLVVNSTQSSVRAVIRQTNDANANSGLAIQKKHSTLHPANHWYGDISFEGWDGSGYHKGGLIECVANGTPANDNMPGELRFSTNAGGTNPTKILTITKDGKLYHTGGGNGRRYSFASDGSSHYMKHDTTLNGIILNGYGGITFETNGTNERVRIDSNGRLIIGHTAAQGDFHGPYGTNNRNPQFQINGTNISNASMSITSWDNNVVGYYGAGIFLARSGSSTKGTNGRVTNTNTILGSIIFSGDDGTDFVKGAMIQGAVDNATGDNDMPARLMFLTTPDSAQDPEERLRISSDGEVFIGANFGTANRSTLLSISGANQNPTGVWTQVGIYADGGQAADKGGSIGFGGPDGSTSQQQFSAIKGSKENGTSGNYAGYMAFYTRPSGAVTSEKMRITSTGAVNIGNNFVGYSIWNTLATDQTPRLQVKSNVGEPQGMALLEERGDSNGPSFILGKSRGGSGVGAINSGDQLGWIKFSGADGTRQHNAAGIMGWNNGTIATGRVAGNLSFYTAPDSVSGFTERMRIKSDGEIHYNNGTVRYENTGGGFNQVRHLEFPIYFSSGTTHTVVTIGGSLDSGLVCFAVLEYIGLYSYASNPMSGGVRRAYTRRTHNNTQWRDFDDQVHENVGENYRPNLNWDNGVLKVTTPGSTQITGWIRVTAHANGMNNFTLTRN